MQPPGNIQDIYRQQGWNDSAAINADIAAGGWKTKVPQTGGGGNNSPNISSVPSVSSFQNELAGQENTALEGLITQMQGRRDPLDVFREFETEAGLPQLRQTAKTLSGEISNIEDVLEGVPGQVAARTRESMVTEGMRGKMVESQSEPHREKLAKLAQGLGRLGDLISLANQGVLTSTELFLKGQEMGLEPHQLRYAALQDMNARKLSAFSADRETQLNQIYAQWERTNQLSDMEWKLANQLASEEKSYVQSLQAAAAGLGYSVTGSESTDHLLSIIGQKSSEQIAFDRKPKGGGTTASERQQEETKKQLLEDIQGWMGGGDLINVYGNELPLSVIVHEYNKGPMAQMFGPVKSEEVSKFVQFGTTQPIFEENPT